jgi:hypothetical protein
MQYMKRGRADSMAWTLIAFPQTPSNRGTVYCTTLNLGLYWISGFCNWMLNSIVCHMRRHWSRGTSAQYPGGNDADLSRRRTQGSGARVLSLRGKKNLPHLGKLWAWHQWSTSIAEAWLNKKKTKHLLSSKVRWFPLSTKIMLSVRSYLHTNPTTTTFWPVVGWVVRVRHVSVEP